MPDDDQVTSACPTCGVVEARTPYDIGSGRELACRHCEWCWGADGQALKPYVPPPEVQRFLDERRGHRDDQG